MKNTDTPLNFWSQVWQEGLIRFHQQEYNSEMREFFCDIDLKDKTVFIPLAGKTLDILYFLEKGAKVTAIEFVEQAIVDFFEDNKILYTKNDQLYQCTNLDFYTTDFFHFQSDKNFDVLYDRASQVVFPPETRARYYQQMANLISPETIVLLAAIDHDGPADYGPPYKIAKEEVIGAYKKMGINLKLFSEKFEVAGEKMQNTGIAGLTAYFLTND